MRVFTFWAAGKDLVSIPTEMLCKTEAEWLAQRDSLEENAYAVALYVVVE